MIAVTFSGTTYQIPEDGSESWPELTDYLVALSTAATTLSMTYSSRVATTTPDNVLYTDTIILMNVGSASSSVLPVGVVGQFIGIYDFSGAAKTNNIVISGPANINGSATYTIASNYGGVLLQYNGTMWQIISEVSLDVILRTLYRQNDPTNNSLVEGGVVAAGGFPSVANSKSCNFDLIGTNFYRFWISLSDGTGFTCTCNYASADISAPSDMSGVFLDTDAGVGIYVWKTAGDSTINIKNRTGGAMGIEIHTETGKITNPANWA